MSEKVDEFKEPTDEDGLLEWELVVVSFARAYSSLDEATAAVQEHLGRVLRNGEQFDFCLD